MYLFFRFFLFIGILLPLGGGWERGPSGFQFLYLRHVAGGNALALGLETLDTDEVFGFDVEWFAEVVGTTHGDEQVRVGGVGEQDEPALGILAEIALVACCGLECETLHVGVALLVGIEETSRPHLIRVVLLDAQDVVLIVVVHVEVGGIELTILADDQNLFIAVEFAQIFTLPIVVEALDIGVEPHLATTQRTGSVTTQADVGHIEFRHQVTHALTAFDGYF